MGASHRGDSGAGHHEENWCDKTLTMVEDTGLEWNCSRPSIGGSSASGADFASGETSSERLWWDDLKKRSTRFDLKRRRRFWEVRNKSEMFSRSSTITRTPLFFAPTVQKKKSDVWHSWLEQIQPTDKQNLKARPFHMKILFDGYH